MYSKTWIPTNAAPRMIVAISHFLRPAWSPCSIAAKALTIVTELQISMKVLKPVSGTLSTAPVPPTAPGARTAG